MTAEYITIQIRRPSESYPAGLIEEGWLSSKTTWFFYLTARETRCLGRAIDAQSGQVRQGVKLL